MSYLYGILIGKAKKIYAQIVFGLLEIRKVLAEANEKVLFAWRHENWTWLHFIWLSKQVNFEIFGGFLSIHIFVASIFCMLNLEIMHLELQVLTINRFAGDRSVGSEIYSFSCPNQLRICMYIILCYWGKSIGIKWIRKEQKVSQMTICYCQYS